MAFQNNLQCTFVCTLIAIKSWMLLLNVHFHFFPLNSNKFTGTAGYPGLECCFSFKPFNRILGRSSLSLIRHLLDFTTTWCFSNNFTWCFSKNFTCCFSNSITWCFSKNFTPFNWCLVRPNNVIGVNILVCQLFLHQGTKHVHVLAFNRDLENLSTNNKCFKFSVPKMNFSQSSL